MLNVSNFFLESIGKPVMLNLKGTITTENGTVINWDKSNIVRNSFSISDRCVKGSSFNFGAINATSLTATMYLDGVSAYSLVGQTIKAYYGCEDEDITLGTFEIIKANQKNTNCIDITGTTQISRIDYNDDKQNPPSTWLNTTKEIYYIIEDICNHAGVNFSNTLDEISAFPNAHMQVALQDDCTITSSSDLLSYLASIMGCFVTSDRETGGIRFAMFKTSPCWTIPLNTIYRGTLSTAGFMIDIVCMIANFYKNGAWASYAASGRQRTSLNDITIDFSDNPFLDTAYKNYEKIYSTSEALDYIIAREIEVGEATKDIPYRPFSLSMAGNPALELGDCVNIEMPDGSIFTSVISSYSFNFRGQHNIQCVGDDGRTVGGLGITDTLRMEEHINQRINSISRSPLMSKSQYKALGDNYQKGVLYCLCEDEDLPT